jgi:hypothetical protein
MITNLLNSNEKVPLDFKDKTFNDIIGSLELKSPKKVVKQLYQYLLNKNKESNESNFHS